MWEFFFLYISKKKKKQQFFEMCKYFMLCVGLVTGIYYSVKLISHKKNVFNVFTFVYYNMS